MVLRRATTLATMTLILMMMAATASRSKSETAVSNVQKVENSIACLDCHEDYDQSLSLTVHRVADRAVTGGGSQVTCIDCHGGWEEHLEDPSAENISSVSEEPQAAQAEICGQCHVTPHQAAMVSTDPHGNAGLACADCHTLHYNESPKLNKDDRENYCLACHSNVAAEFKRRSSHPLEAENIRCVDCHSQDGASDPMMATGLDWTCQGCHSELSGPFPFEHEVVNQHAVNGGGCIECHQPHGSSNDRLLSQPGSGTCNSCHGVPPLHRTRHGGLGASMPCVDCHSDIHGSYDNKKLLDPLLNTRLFADCYQSGCHIFGN